MEFYIVAEYAFETEEVAENFVQRGLKNFFGYSFTAYNAPTQPKQITPQLLIKHLEQTAPFSRKIYNELDGAIAAATEKAKTIRDTKAIILYACELPTQGCNSRYVGAPAKIPTNSFFMAGDQFSYTHFLMINNKGKISELDNVPASTVKRRRIED